MHSEKEPMFNENSEMVEKSIGGIGVASGKPHSAAGVRIPKNPFIDIRSRRIPTEGEVKLVLALVALGVVAMLFCALVGWLCSLFDIDPATGIVPGGRFLAAALVFLLLVAGWIFAAWAAGFFYIGILVVLDILLWILTLAAEWLLRCKEDSIYRKIRLTVYLMYLVAGPAIAFYLATILWARDPSSRHHLIVFGSAALLGIAFGLIDFAKRYSCRASKKRSRDASDEAFLDWLYSSYGEY